MPLQREGLITLWADTDINAGAEWENTLHSHLNTAQIILLLVSPDFLASEYCYSTEIQRALERHENGEAEVIPIIMRPTDWQNLPFGKLQALPKNAMPVESSAGHTRDEAFLSIVEGIRKVVEDLYSQNDGTDLDSRPDSPPLPKKVTRPLRQRLQRYLLWGIISVTTLTLIGSLIGPLLSRVHLPGNASNFNQVNVLNLNDSGPGSLRQAILTANASVDNSITFDPTLRGTIVLTSGELTIYQNLTIEGPGASVLAVSGDNRSRVFQILNAITVSISGLAIIHGMAKDSGGGLQNLGDLRLANVIVSGNTSAASGGGIANGGTLTLTNSILSENTSVGGDGGISSGGVLTIVSSTIEHNTGGYTGGIDIGLSLYMINSTVTENTAPSSGAAGGISIGSGGFANIHYSTIY
jgi:hypothetical protein